MVRCNVTDCIALRCNLVYRSVMQCTMVYCVVLWDDEIYYKFDRRIGTALNLTLSICYLLVVILLFSCFVMKSVQTYEGE